MVQNISKEDGLFTVKTKANSFIGKTIVLSTGSTYRLLGIPNETELIGSGIHFCATCDGAFYRDKDIIVIGGGNSALEEGIFLAGFCKSVKIVNNSNTFKASETYIEKLKTIDNISTYMNKTSLEFIAGENKLFKSLKVKDNETNQEELISADGVFIFIGLIPNTKPFEGLIELNERNFIKTTGLAETNVKGIFENATRIFAGFAQPQSFYAVYYRFQDKDWAKAKFGELNISYLAGQIDGSCGSLQRCNGASAGKVSGTVGFSQYGVTEPGGQTDTYHLGGGLEIHEYTHIAQAMQFIGKQKDDQNFNYLPRWFIEGHAHIAGNTGAAKTIEEYTKYRADWLRTSPNAEIKSFEPVDIERFYASLMPGKYNNEMFGYVYTVGYITMECLVALKGIDSPTQLIVEVSNGLTFEEAFLKVYGISWNEASPILAKTVSQIFLAR